MNFTAQMYLNDEPPITAGREIWGFPKRWDEPALSVETDTLTGTLDYLHDYLADEPVLSTDANCEVSAER